MCSSICVMNRGQLPPRGVDEVRRLLGRAERTPHGRGARTSGSSGAWIAAQGGVSHLQRAGDRVSFAFSGTQRRNRPRLLSGLITQDLRVTVFGEQKSTFEEILIDWLRTICPHERICRHVHRRSTARASCLGKFGRIRRAPIRAGAPADEARGGLVDSHSAAGVVCIFRYSGRRDLPREGSGQQRRTGPIDGAVYYASCICSF